MLQNEMIGWVEPEAHDVDFSDTMAGVDQEIDAGYADLGGCGSTASAMAPAWARGCWVTPVASGQRRSRTAKLGS
jgi:hypothetical protein